VSLGSENGVFGTRFVMVILFLLPRRLHHRFSMVSWYPVLEWYCWLILWAERIWIF